MLAALAIVACALWIYLLAARGRFWRADVRLPSDVTAPADWPPVVAIVPARNEAATIGACVQSLLRQDYAGALSVVVVDDHSDDATAEAARRAADNAGERLTVARATPLPAGWTGKVWALAQGVAAAQNSDAGYLWFTDADISHEPATLRRLMALAARDDLDIASLMVMLRCRTSWERLLIPPFVFFFQKLYPFAWVQDPRRRTAAAAGGCVLVRRAALERAGGLAPIAGALIDDCSLAALIKAKGRMGGGRLWLGLTPASLSLRGYDTLAQIWRMVARSAYTQLDHSPARLMGTVAGMTVIYAVPPALALSWPVHGDSLAGGAALAAWAMMAAAMAPTLRLYNEPAWRGVLLPAAALLYVLMTLSSAVDHWRGRGGVWKGRAAPRGEPRHAR